MSELQSKIMFLGSLALLGVGLAVAGTAVGVPTPLVDSQPSSEFVVSAENVTLEHGDEQAAVVEDMSHVDQVEIDRQDGGTFHVNTTTEQPLTERDRRDAQAIARTNETVRQALADVEQYEMTVEPIQQISADAMETTTLSGLNETSTDNGTETATFSISTGGQNESVTIDRDPTYLEDEATVRVVHPGEDETYYSITVDLETETVTDITDWTDI
ncbi:hypothetical protein [Natronobacterium lacisalsi]|uniref:hypothetical protein n=1 Tax=Natronobacterium lacisalsi TaxID=229731 RepID=UPI001EE696B0|nr:hypothetical protein [Halobiforma lacisalsi]